MGIFKESYKGHRKAFERLHSGDTIPIGALLFIKIELGKIIRLCSIVYSV